MPQRNRRDHAVEKAARGDTGSPATPVDRDSTIEVDHAVERQQTSPREKSPQCCFPFIGASAGGDLGNDGLCDSELAVGRNEFGKSAVDRTSGGPVIFDPGRRVGEDHAAAPRGGWSAGTSPIEFEPRIASASSRVIGSAASLRRARSTTSVLVRRRYRRMIVWTYSSSISMFVRTLAIHVSYTFLVRHRPRQSTSVPVAQIGPAAGETPQTKIGPRPETRSDLGLQRAGSRLQHANRCPVVQVPGFLLPLAREHRASAQFGPARARGDQ